MCHKHMNGFKIREMHSHATTRYQKVLFDSLTVLQNCYKSLERVAMAQERYDAILDEQTIEDGFKLHCRVDRTFFWLFFPLFCKCGKLLMESEQKF